MQTVYCPKCGLDWTLDDIHAEADDSDRTFREVRTDFRGNGCKAFAVSYGAGVEDDCRGRGRDETRAQFSAALMDVMGDDMDGVASMLDDAEYLGLI